MFHYDYEEEVIELALIIVTQMIEAGTKYGFSYNSFIDILGQSSMGR